MSYDGKDIPKSLDEFTIVKADKILHLKDGKVLEEGRHSDLMKKGEAYAKMYKIQANNIIN